MLRITVERQAVQILITLEGRLAGEWVEELRKVLTTLHPRSDIRNIAINLTSVAGMDSPGRALLIDLHAHGAHLKGTGLAARAFIEEVAGARHGNGRNLRLLP